jgi:hypothetical protein
MDALLTASQVHVLNDMVNVNVELKRIWSVAFFAYSKRVHTRSQSLSGSEEDHKVISVRIACRRRSFEPKILRI